MDLRRLEYLSEFCRLGSMRAVADEMHVTTSTVSQQIAALATEVGTPLVEPQGRRVRLTPAGRRLADHAVTILAAVEAARWDLDPAAEPSGTLRVASFATAARRSLMPIIADLCRSGQPVVLRIHEHEPDEAFELLLSDHVDLALTYDFNLAPAVFDSSFEVTPLWTAPWSLGVRGDAAADAVAGGPIGKAPAVLERFRDGDWIVNSRNTADEHVIRTIASMAGFEPRIEHRVDSLELVQDLILAGLGIGLLPQAGATAPGVELLPLADPDVLLRSYAVVRRGRADWPPLALVLRELLGRDLLAPAPLAAVGGS